LKIHHFEIERWFEREIFKIHQPFILQMKERKRGEGERDIQSLARVFKPKVSPNVLRFRIENPSVW
jgi:hypothetical protein